MKEPLVNYEGWGLDPSYQTPAWMAQYRPAYKQRLVEKARKRKDKK